ncbi:MAG: hypothetical protein H8D67_08905 [Deltaproteobacteria bacterium]|nr:hypothetical protein [Deltaproteobacteria bacterium]
MTHKERVLAALERRSVDRTPLWCGSPKPETIENLLNFYKVKDRESLLQRIGDDFRWISGLNWNHPEGKPIFDPYFGMEGQRSHASPGIFANCNDTGEVERYPWPEPQYVNCDSLEERLRPYNDYAILGGAWAPFFHNVANFFGMENYFVKMYTCPKVVEAVTERVVDFYLAANEKIFTSANGGIDIYFFGNDFGSQKGLLISPEMFQRFILPHIHRLVEQAKKFSLKVMLHCCGAISQIIPYLIDIGIDGLHPMQVEGEGMDPEKLAAEFRDNITFMGGISTQQLLRKGTEEQVRQNVRYMKRLFGDGYIVSTSHEAILPDIPVENLAAMFDEAAAL